MTIIDRLFIAITSRIVPYAPLTFLSVLFSSALAPTLSVLEDKYGLLDETENRKV